MSDIELSDSEIPFSPKTWAQWGHSDSNDSIHSCDEMEEDLTKPDSRKNLQSDDENAYGDEMDEDLTKQDSRKNLQSDDENAYGDEDDLTKHDSRKNLQSDDENAYGDEDDLTKHDSRKNLQSDDENAYGDEDDLTKQDSRKNIQSDDEHEVDGGIYSSHGVESDDKNAEESETGNPMETESGHESDYSRADVTVEKKTSFLIEFEKWKEFPITVNKRGDRRLGGEWTNTLFKGFQEKNPFCPLVFTWNHIKKKESRKKSTKYFTATAKCKFHGCLKYKFTVNREPSGTTPVKVKARIVGNKRTINHDIGITKGRPITGKHRQEVAAEVKLRGPTNAYYDKVGTIPPKAFDYGNTSVCGTKDVLRKIASELALEGRFSKDVHSEIVVLKDVYEKEDEEENHSTVKGAIRSISVYPFTVIFYTIDQIVILAENIRQGTAILHFDATGKVVAKIPFQKKKVFYYALLLKGLEPGDPPVPAAEMISNSHNTTDITGFFMKLMRDLHICCPSVGRPQRIEIDFTYAFIHAILLSCNHEDIQMYLQRSWMVLRGKQQWESQTKIHICSAHLLHRLSGRLKTLIPDKETRRYILFVVARMTEANSLSDLDSMFTDLCVLLLSRDEHQHPDFNESRSRLNDLISQQTPPEVNETGKKYVPDGEDFEASGPRPKDSPFSQHYISLRDSVTSVLNQTTTTESKNGFFCPDFVTYMLSHYMSITPLWTGCLLEGISHDTNSPAENWMRILKKDILAGETKFTPARFVTNVRHSVRGRLVEYKKKLKDKFMKTRKRVKVSTDFDHSEERWNKKSKMQKGLFKSPSQMPLPKQKKEKKQKKAVGERGLRWGGKVQLEDRVVHLSNTCTIDNMLMIMHMALRIDNIKTWFEEQDMDVCQTILEVDSLFKSGHWSEGKTLWITTYLDPSKVPATDTWDIYGSEVDKFVIHYAQVQESASHSDCSKRRCPEKSQSLQYKEIILGCEETEGESEPGLLQESIRQWEEVLPSSCGAGKPSRPCNGQRTWTKRQFLHNPPVLIMSVSYLSQHKGLDANQLPSSILIASKSYKLFAYTMCGGGHFWCYFLRGDQWYVYDGISSPEVKPCSVPRRRGVLEHVVFVEEL